MTNNLTFGVGIDLTQLYQIVTLRCHNRKCVHNIEAKEKFYCGLKVIEIGSDGVCVKKETGEC